MKVLKFGGSSVGSKESIEAVLDIVRKTQEKGEKPIVVLSAMEGVTNLLGEMAENAARGASNEEEIEYLQTKHFEVIKALLPVKKQNPVLTRLKLLFNELEDLLSSVETLKELSLQSKDLILSYGERCCAFMVAKIAEHLFDEAMYIDARNVIKTDSNFGNAAVDKKATKTLITSLKQSYGKKVLFVTGFIGSNGEGRTTTLGRGGSDYTAALFASILGASVIEIWTDVNGIHTADPRIVRKAFPLKDLSYIEAMELSYFGAKVIYPPTMIPAFTKKIPIRIKNTFEPDAEGTCIQHQSGPSTLPIKGISSISEVSLINISGSGMVGETGFSGRLFALLAQAHINVILITQSSSEHSITFAISPEDADKALKLIRHEFELELATHKLYEPEIERELSVLAIVGENMKRTTGVAGKLFRALGRNGVNVRAIAQGSSEYNISVIISKKDLAKGLNTVHSAFFEELTKTLNVFIVGLGNIGKTLLKQIESQYIFLSEQNNIDIKLVGLANTKKMYIKEEGISMQNWEDEFLQNGEPANLSRFIENMGEMNLPNCVFIDNTASPVPTTYYADVFKKNISIVTCNKIANSGTYANYKLLKDTAKAYGVEFYYETNAGAGLPIIRVLKDLMLSGDEIVKIEAILSGTISYIFNNFKGEVSFHDVVKQAQEAGFTEPDPRDDLGGVDFMRKMLILGRDAGYPLEAEDVDLGAILPEACLKADSVESFYQSLLDEAAYFEKMKEKAASENKAIRYIGSLEYGKVKIGIQYVDQGHPFYALSGSDNIISFTTKRYKDTPLVVKGPGAGAEVTAGGVFADLVNVGSR